MKNMKQVLFLTLFAMAPMWADDIRFVSPTPHAQVKDQLTIQILPPYQNQNVRVWIERDMPNGDQVMWNGELTTQGNYTSVVNVSQFPAGKYEVKAEYYMGGEDFDGDVTFWIGNMGYQKN